MKLTLETKRLLLRPFREEDAEAVFYGWASDPEVTRYLTWNTHENIETTKYVLGEWLKEYEQPERLNFAIELKSTGQLIGGIDVVGYHNGVPVIGYKFSKKILELRLHDRSLPLCVGLSVCCRLQSSRN